MLTERIHRNATWACVSLTYRAPQAETDGHTNGVIIIIIVIIIIVVVVVVVVVLIPQVLKIPGVKNKQIASSRNMIQNDCIFIVMYPFCRQRRARVTAKKRRRCNVHGPHTLVSSVL